MNAPLSLMFLIFPTKRFPPISITADKSMLALGLRFFLSSRTMSRFQAAGDFFSTDSDQTEKPARAWPLARAALPKIFWQAPNLPQARRRMESKRKAPSARASS